ncbi:DgyrCDS579 [Dimorphilus gyrociliatus]|uniref:Acyltransferase n=1 Tax=Dimorphilus gyrociliatus TaxID=2664684 RepID=A0A7I8V6T9_9ANNE|nr:DgyrCDS579 [Dimorphilus gyrociliatus]
MTSKLGIKWAPIFGLPLKRRLQTAAVMHYPLGLIFVPFLSLFLAYYLLMTIIWWIVPAYLAWMVYDIAICKTSSRGGRRIEYFRHLKIWKYFRDYFPITLIKTADLDPSRNYIMGSHPHGILGCGAFCNFATEANNVSKVFPGITPHILTLISNFNWPIVRGYIMWLGICDVSKESIKWILTKKGQGQAAIIVVGGAQEALDARPNNYILTLKNRKGFVKLALQQGASLVPIYSFGENDLFNQAPNPHGSRLRKFQILFKKLSGIAPAFFYGRGVFNYTFGFVPHRKPVRTVVGKPIYLEKEPNPTKERINEVHQQYMDGLTRIFEDYKEKFGVDKDTKLEFV